jgi:FemAB-related protein (PEP-CTERM system-associated)
MNIKLAGDLDSSAWNDYIINNTDSTPYHNYAWKQSIENAYGFECPYLIAQDDNGSIIGVLPLVKITSPMMTGKLCSLPYCDLGGCLASDQQTEKQLIDNAVELLHKYRLGVFEYRTSTHIQVDDVMQLQNQKVRMLLNLPASPEDLLSSFKAKLRSQIKKSEKNGLTYQLGNNPKLVTLFYDVIANNMKLLGSPVHSKNWYREICQNYGDKAVISIVMYKNEVAGAGLILVNGDKVSIPWASTIRKFNPLAPNMLLYWSVLAESTKMGCRQFDFGRSSYGEGTFRFKQQWGAKPVPLEWKNLYVGSNQGFQIQKSTSDKSKSRLLVESVWRKLPLYFTIVVGSNIRKYITL